MGLIAPPLDLPGFLPQGASGVAIIVYRLRAGAAAWDRPTIAYSLTAWSAQNPVLMYEPNSATTVLVHTLQQACCGQGTSEARWPPAPARPLSSAVRLLPNRACAHQQPDPSAGACC